MKRFLGVIGLACVLAGCGGSKVDPAAMSAGFRELNADQVIVGFQQYISEAGVKKADVLGDTAYVFEDSSFAKVKNVRLTLYDERGSVSAKLKANSGDVYSQSQAMIARGNVVLNVLSDGSTIETQELHYDPNTHRIWSNVQTTQRKGSGTLSGSGFEADDKFENVRITNAHSTGGGFRIQF